MSKATARLLPLLTVGFIVAYMDRTNISFASEQMNRALGFSATIYGLGAGLFFLAYASFEVPSNMLLVRFGARRWIARIMFTWGLIAIGMAFVREPWQFYAMRFLLGIAEAGFFPGIMYYLTQWFPANQRARAISRFYIALPLGTAIMGAVAGSLLSLQGRLGLAGWQWMFIVEGIPALLMSIAILRWLPDGPSQARWLTQPERGWIARALAKDPTGAPPAAGHNVLRTLGHPVVLRFGVFFFLVLGANITFTFSAPILLGQATHLDASGVGYLISAANLVATLVMLLNCWHSDRTGERHWHMIVPLGFVALASLVWVAFPTPAIVIGAYFIAMMAYYAMITLVWPLASAELSPPMVAVSFAAINSIGQLGSFVAPFAWGWAKDATGSYNAGLWVLPIPYAVGAVIVLLSGRRGLVQRTEPAAVVR